MKLLILFSLVALCKGGTKCYGDLGCFSSGSPFYAFPQRPFSVTPQSPDVILTTYQLYTRQNKDKPQLLDARKTQGISKTWTNFQEKATKIIIHGFYDDPKTALWMKEMADAFLKADDVNAIIVDWHHGNKLPYTQATANTRVVGAQVAVLIKALVAQYKLTVKDFHVVGHSLGAHTAGYAGERVPGLARITGLDAAGPYFTGTDKAVRLDPTDAVFVDAIHTDAAFLKGLGTEQAVGHEDFYPNGGHDQPGCPQNPLGNALDSFFSGVKNFFTCNHHRAFVYFTESITSKCAFKGYPCQSEADFKAGKCNTCSADKPCVSMGNGAKKMSFVNNSHRVKYYLKTSDKTPFCEQ